jgi:NIMA-interacting peptidyl-prolyl cis-trans isomerase 1
MDGMDVDNLDIVTAVADAVASAVKSGPPPSALPTGWILRESRSNPGYFYYFHMDTGVISWSPPAVQQEEEEQQQQQQTQLQAQPVAVEDEDAMDGVPPNHPDDNHNNNSNNNTTEKDHSKEEDPETAEDRSSKRRKGGEEATTSSGSSAPKEVRVLHILKKHKGSRRPSSWRQATITHTVEEAKEELVGMLEILQEEEANPAELRATFEELARTESDCSSAKRGGDLGFFGRRKMQPAFEAASFGLRIGELTKEIVETSSGVHLILRIG